MSAPRRTTTAFVLGGVLFSHPGDFTPVCTTELGERNVKIIEISTNTLADYSKWEFWPEDVQFPIIADADRKISYLYDMLDYEDTTNVDTKGLPFTIRTVFVIDPKKIIRLTISYPAVVGDNFYRIATPVSWKKGEGVIIHASVNNEEANTLFPNFKTHLPYLRTTPLQQVD
ncbi:cysteine peroxiredoxin [Mycena floridula]|nr:cysteine peroxiredoxin [Mycena floridula]